ncbi:MAG: hypothetical protein ACREQH_11450 [Candidatus Binatus sp.]
MRLIAILSVAVLAFAICACSSKPSVKGGIRAPHFHTISVTPTASPTPASSP